MNSIVIMCEHCGSSKSILKTNYNKKIKDGTRFYCSNKCSALDNKKYSSPFNYYVHSCNKRYKQSFNLTNEYLEGLWKKQDGCCNISNIKLELPLGARGFKTKKPFNGASLDRIDSNKGYIEGNVQFICMGLNYMKNNWPEEYFIKNLIEVSKSVVDKYNNMLDNNNVIEV